LKNSVMKLLVFSPYYPPHMGGLESHSAEFNKELAQLGNTITVFTPLLPKEAPPEEKVENITIIRYPAFEVISNYPLPIFWHSLFWRQLFSLKKIAEPDIVITRTRFFFLSLIGLLFSKVYRLPHIHIEHGSDFVRLSNKLSSLLSYLYDQTLGRCVFRFSTVNISISHAVQKFVSRFDSRPSPVIYRGLDFTELDETAPFLPETLKLYSGKLILTTAARLYKWKGIERTLEALRNLPVETRDQIVFVVVGDGEDKTRLEKLAQGLPVVFLGRLSRKQTIGFLKNTNIYIHSSYPGGGLSTSLLEAMYCRCAVIATPHEGADEIITHKENGLLISDSNPEETAEALKRLIQNPSLREHLTLTGELLIKREFNWEKSAALYNKVLKGL
jgi:glycosyltransferase involved in cell wall biosynthesis